MPEDEEFLEISFMFGGDRMSSIPDSCRRTADKTEAPVRCTRGVLRFGEGQLLAA